MNRRIVGSEWINVGENVILHPNSSAHNGASPSRFIIWPLDGASIGGRQYRQLAVIDGTPGARDRLYPT